MADRKPLIILVVLVLVAVVAYLVGVFGAGREDSSPWPEWATPDLAPGDRLTVDDLTGSPGCEINGPVIVFVDVCRVSVREVAGGWPWQAATRRALLVVTAGPVDLAVTLAGRALRADLDPGDDIRLTYTRDGGDFTLGCLSIGGCAVTLTEDA